MSKPSEQRFCRDCKWMRHDTNYVGGMKCIHPDIAGVNLVTGGPARATSCEYQREENSKRNPDTTWCEEVGVYWERGSQGHEDLFLKVGPLAVIGFIVLLAWVLR